MSNQLRLLKSNNAKEYWNIINKSIESKKTYCKISAEVFGDYFKTLMSGPENDTNVNNNTSPTTNNYINELFSEEEVLKSIKSLKTINHMVLT